MPGNRSAALSLEDEWGFPKESATPAEGYLRRQTFKVVALEIDGVRVWEQPGPTATIEPDKKGGMDSECRERSKMVRTELMGGHTHRTVVGIDVHIWKRDTKYLVRGRLEGRSFAETIGDNLTQATSRLRQLLTEIENGSYVRSTEARKRRISRLRTRRLTLRELVAEFVAHKRQTLGLRTAGVYASRLAPVLDFAEKAANLKRWPLASDIDSEFVSSLRAFLFEYKSTRNGRSGGHPRPLSSRQIVNVMECVRALFNWAKSGANRRLPADWVMPLTPELVGTPPLKNPLQEDRLPLDARVALARHADDWQFCQLGISLVLPLRPNEVAGLIISDVNFDKGWLEFGERFTGCNFTKARTAFNVPFPEELRPLLRACIGDRTEGPVFRSRAAFGTDQRLEQATSLEDLNDLFQATLSRSPRGTVQSEQDRKLVFRKLLRRLGGVSEDVLSKEFKRLLAVADLKAAPAISLYALRRSITTAMHRAGVQHLELRYLTGHAANDILNHYTGLDPVGAMRRYFDAIRPLLNAIAERAKPLGLV